MISNKHVYKIKNIFSGILLIKTFNLIFVLDNFSAAIFNNTMLLPILVNFTSLMINDRWDIVGDITLFLFWQKPWFAESIQCWIGYPKHVSFSLPCMLSHLNGIYSRTWLMICTGKEILCRNRHGVGYCFIERKVTRSILFWKI